jgi:hypothetical protein
MSRYLLLFDSYGLVFLWGTLSDERTGLSFVYAAGSFQRRLPRVRVPWDSRPYFTVPDLRLPFSSPPTTRKITVEVFDATSTRILTRIDDYLQDNSSARTPWKTPPSFVKNACLQLHCLAINVSLFREFAWRWPHRKQFPLYCCHGLKVGCLQAVA